MSTPLAELDPDIAELLGKELGRQRDTLEMIASENFVPRAVLQAHGSVLTNKYAEGLPGRRYYGGCEHVDVVENIARDRAKELFGAEFANVQPHSGAQANAAVLQALMEPGDRLLGLDLANGGHLTHGMRLNFSGKLYENAFYGVDPVTHRVDMDVVRAQALEFKPKVIIAGWSAYPRILDFEAFAAIADEVDATLWVDMAHFAGLVAAGLHPSPVPHAQVVSTTVHKTLGGPRSGLIVGKKEFAKQINSAVFPGQQGGPLMHVIAAKASRSRSPARPSSPSVSSGCSPARRSSPSGCWPPTWPRPASRWSVAVPTCTWCSSTCGTRRWTARWPRTCCTRSVSPSTATRSRTTRDRRWSPPGFGWAPRRWPPVVSATPSSPRSPMSSPPRWLRARALTCRRCGPGSPSWHRTSRCTTAWRTGSSPKGPDTPDRS